MVLYSEIEKAYNEQKENLFIGKDSVQRIIPNMPGKTGHVDIITGIRRCGKSTFLNQLASGKKQSIAYFNFEDPRIFDFEAGDFPKLLQVMGEKVKEFYFDEIQNIEGWEVFVRNLHDQKKKVFITGSNASLLSRELGTRLTGRQFSHELFPFSFKEYLQFKKSEASAKKFNGYLEQGGFPEYLKYGSVETLQHLFKDIIYRDIVVRYGIRNVKVLMDIALYLISNAGNEYTLNRLKNSFNIGSANSVAEYVGWFEDSYLIFSVQQFSWSVKSKAVNPKKVYTIDTGFARANSLSYTNDLGRLLENAVFLHLRRNGYEINYFKQKGECDFVVFGSKEFAGAFQVCTDLNLDNKNREVNGLIEALHFFDKPSGIILTLDQEDFIKISSKEIKVVPVWKWILDKY
jgi:uncharacterized protein